MTHHGSLRMAGVFDFTHARSTAGRDGDAAESMLENYAEPGHLKRVYAYVNADFVTDKENAPAGTLAIHDMDAPIHPDSIPDNAFEYLIVCPVIDRARCDESRFRGKECAERIGAAAPQYAIPPIQMKTRDPRTNGDGRNGWGQELGANGFAGIYKAMRPNQRDVDYYVIAQSGAPVAAQQLKALLTQRPMTFRSFLDSPEYAYVKDAATRNTQRLAYEIARAAKVPITHTIDVVGGRTMLAVPMNTQDLQPVSTIDRISYGGEECAAIYHRCRPANIINRQLYVTAAPYDGIVRFNMANGVIGYALPSDTGRSAAVVARVPIQSDGLQWEGDKAWNPLLAPNAYNPIDETLLSALKTSGWKQEGLNDRTYFIPVQVKIGNPDLKRP